MPWKHAIPLILFAVIAAALFVGLSLDPKQIPSALIDKPVPDFELPGIDGAGPGLSSDDLRQGRVTLVNVWASWCVPCRAEHPILMKIKADGLAPLFGLNYKDKPSQAGAFLKELGNPFDRIGADRDGRVGIDWGVYGVPETFVVDGAGRIRLKHIGPMTQFDVDSKIRPLIEKLLAEAEKLGADAKKLGTGS